MATEQNDTSLVVWNGESVPLTVKILLEAPLRGDTFGAKLNLVMSFWNERPKLTVPAGATPFVPFDRANLTKAHVSTMLTLKADPNVKRGPFAVGQLNPGKLIEAVLKSPKVADADKLKLCESSSTTRSTPRPWRRRPSSSRSARARRRWSSTASRTGWGGTSSTSGGGVRRAQRRLSKITSVGT